MKNDTRFDLLMLVLMFAVIGRSQSASSHYPRQ